MMKLVLGIWGVSVNLAGKQVPSLTICRRKLWMLHFLPGETSNQTVCGSCSVPKAVLSHEKT